MAGLGPFHTRWIIPVVDTSLTLRGSLAIPLSSRYNQMWFSRALESSPFSVMLQKQTNHFPVGKIGGPKELPNGQMGAGASLWEPAGISEDKTIRLCYRQPLGRPRCPLPQVTSPTPSQAWGPRPAGCMHQLSLQVSTPYTTNSSLGHRTNPQAHT